ncbi:MAG: acyl-CoA dehydrogenase C-terminal domain-containing protein, partial [Pseudomonadota bacterium]
RLEYALESFINLTGRLVALAQGGKTELFLADATLYLELFGIIAVAGQWLRQGASIQRALEGSLSEMETRFYQGKLTTFRFFYHYELPKMQGLLSRLGESDGLTVSMEGDFFKD